MWREALAVAFKNAMPVNLAQIEPSSAATHIRGWMRRYSLLAEFNTLWR